MSLEHFVGRRGRSHLGSVFFLIRIIGIFTSVLLLLPGAHSASLVERFTTDPVAGGRFTAQTAGTESSFQFNTGAGNLAAVLDVDASTAYYLSNPFPAVTDRDTVSFSFNFRVESFDDRVPPTSFIGLMTQQHVENFGDGLTVNLATSGGQLIATASIDTAGFKSEGAEIPLTIRTNYIAYGAYSAITRRLEVEIFTGPNFTTRVGHSTATLPADRALNLNHLGVQNGGARTTDSTTGSLTLSLDDLATPGEPPVTISVADISLTEGTGGAVNAALQVLLSAPTTKPVLVDYTTVDDTAVAGSDYRATADTLTIPAGATGARLLIPIIPDAVGETNESFRVVFSHPQNANLANFEARITLLDDDLPAVSVGDASTVEGGAGAHDVVLALSLSNPSTQPVSVQYATSDGTATVGTDYRGTNGIAVFPPGITNLTVQLAVLGDAIAEGNETFSVRLSNPLQATLGRAVGVVTILDDDPAPTITVEDASIQEGPAGPRNVAVTLRLSNASALPVSVNVATGGGTATPLVDYLGRSGPLTFSPGQTETNLTVTILGDTVPEDDETFLLTLTKPVNGTLGRATAVVTILDDDRDPVLKVAAAAVKEGAAGQTTHLVFDVRLSPAAAVPVTVNYATVGGTATAGVDFDSQSGVLTFDPGVTLKQVVVPVIGDDVAEPDEQFTLVLSNPLNATLANTEAVGTILTDDSITLSVADVTVTESDGVDVQAVFQVSLTGIPIQPVTVNFFTLNETAQAGLDYRPKSGPLTFQPGQTLQTVSIAVIGDLEDEPEETFKFVLSNPVGASLSRATATGTIRDNDPPALSINNVQVVEGSAGPTVAHFLVRLSSPTFEEVRVDYDVVGKTATAGTDFLPASDTLIFPVGTQELPVDVIVLGDTIDEPDETFLVKLSHEIGATLAVTEGLGTIKDDDEAPRIKIGNVTVNECSGGTADAVFPVTLSAPSEQVVTVNFTTQDGTATAGSDYQATNGVITFPPGTTSQQIHVTLSCDFIDEPNESFFVFLGGPVNGFIDGGGGGEGSIVDDDPPALSVADLAVREGDSGTTNAVFQIRLSSAASDTVTVAFTTLDDTATAGVDYAAVSGLVSFPPGTLSRDVSVPVIGDTLPEGSETFRVQLSNPLNATLGRAEAVGTILDDDQPEIRPEDITVVEGDTGSITAQMPVRLSRTSPQTVTVQYTLSSGTALAGTDFGAASSTLVFAPGQVLQQIPITVLGDLLVEGNEFGTVTFSNPTNGVLPVSQATFTIIDNDGAPVITVSDEAFVEGDVGPQNHFFTFRLSAPSAQTVSVKYATANVTATGGTDYAIRSNTVNFLPGSTNQPVAIAIIGDTAFEPDETFLLVLTNPVNGILARNQAIGTILNDDQPSVVSVENASVQEGRPGGRTNLSFRITLTPANNVPVTVDYAVTAGTATANGDFEPSAATITFPVGITQQIVNVPVLGDADVETDETVFLTLKNPLNAVLGQAVGTGTIVDDDGVGIRISDASVLEPDTGGVSMAFTVSLAKPASEIVTVTYATADRTATAGSDYTSATATLTFPPGTISQKLNIEVKGDRIDEPDETFEVRLTNPVNGTLVTPVGIGTIVDNDPPAISINDVTVAGSSAGSVQANFTLTLSSSTAETVSVDYSTVNGTATAGTDYSEVTSRLVFSPGQVSQTLSIQIKGNTLDEGTEFFLINLTNAVNATVGRSQGRGTILNNLATNQPPTISQVNNQSTLEDTTTPAIAFTIGDTETPLANLNVRASSSDLALIPLGGLVLAGTESQRTLTVKPAKDQFGVATLSVIVTDAGGQTATNRFDLTVVPVNDPPTLDPLADVALRQNDPPLTIPLTGITTGATNEFQTLTVTAASDRPQLIGAPSIDFTSPNPTGSLTLVPVTNASGTATITVIVKDNGGTLNGGQDTVIRQFKVAVAPLPILNIADATGTNGNSGTTPLAFVVNLSAPSDRPVTVEYFTEDGTALAGRDYEGIGGASSTPAAVGGPLQIQRSGEALRLVWPISPDNQVAQSKGDLGGSGDWQTVTALPVVVANQNQIEFPPTSGAQFFRLVTRSRARLTFNPGETNKSILAQVYGRIRHETDKTFFMNLANSANAVLGRRRALGTILNDDPLPVISVSDVTVKEGNTGTTNAIFVATLTLPSEQSLHVDYATIDGSAVAPGDYQTTQGTLVFAPGEITHEIVVPVRGDTLHETNKTFTVRLSNPVNVAFGDPEGVGTILDDDTIPEPPRVTVSQGPNGTVECPAAPVFTPPVFVDSTGSILTPTITTVSNLVSCRKVLTRTWSVVDSQGLATNRTQTLTVVDTTPPAVVTPQGPDATQECASVLGFIAPLFVDACDGVLTPTVVTRTNVIDCTAILTRTWTAVDSCGNSTNRTQVLTIVDTTPPAVITPPGPEGTVEFPAGPVFTPPTFADACDLALAPSVLTTTNVVGCDKVIVRTWIAVDICDNATKQSQKITVLNGAFPTLTCPPTLTATTAPGERSIENLFLGTPITGHNCGEVTVTNDAPALLYLGTNVVTWTATDFKGKQVSCSQLVIIEQSIQPVLTLQARSETNLILHVSSPPDQPCTVQSSDGLGHWVDLHSFPGGEHDFALPPEVLTGRRYFRVYTKP